MNTDIIYSNGDRVPAGVCISQDTTISTFTIEVQHQIPIGPDTIKDLIQKKFKVLNVTQTGRLIVVNQVY